MTGTRNLDDDLDVGVDHDNEQNNDIESEVERAERELKENEDFLNSSEDELPADTVPEADGAKKGNPKMLIILVVVGLAALAGFGFVVKTILFPAVPVDDMAVQQTDAAAQMTEQVAQPIAAIAQEAVTDPVLAAMANLNQEPASQPGASSFEQTYVAEQAPAEVVESALPEVQTQQEVMPVRPAVQPEPVVITNTEPSIDMRAYDEALSSLNTQVSSVNSRLDNSDRQNRKLQDDMAAIRKLLESQVAEQRRIADALTAQKGFSADPLVKRRSRLKGYAVISVTADGQMVIVRDPKNNNIVIERDGSLRDDGVSLKVDELAYNGKLILLGTRFFIDHVFEEKSGEKPVAAAKPVTEKPVVVTTEQPVAALPSQTQTVVQNKPPQIEPGLYIQGDASRQREGRNYLDGWSLNGVVADGFLIRDPNGAFKSVRINESIPGVGTVRGPNGNGDLQVGSFLIRAEN